MVTPEQVKRVIEIPPLLRNLKNVELKKNHDLVHSWTNDEGYWANKPKGITIQEAETFHDLLVKEALRRGLVWGKDLATPIHILPRSKEFLQLRDVTLQPQVLDKDLVGPLIYLDEVLPYLEQSFSVEGKIEVFLSGRLIHEGVTSKDIDIFVKGRQDSKIEEAIKNLFSNPLPSLSPRPDLAERVSVNFVLGGPISGFWVKTHSSRFFAQTYSFDWPREVDVLEARKEAKEQYVGEKVPTQICPHCRKEDVCVLLSRYEPLSDEYLEWLEANPATTPLRFPIACKYAVEFRCPYPKYYFYSDQPLSLEYVVEKVPEILVTPEIKEALEDRKLSRELKKRELKVLDKKSKVLDKKGKLVDKMLGSGEE